MRFDFARIVCASLSLFFVAGRGGDDSSGPLPGDGRVEDRIVYATNYFSSRNEDGTVPARASTRIYTVNPDGRGRKRLLAGTKSYDSSPTFSPDGTKILFQRYDSSPGHLVVMNADGTDQQSTAIIPETVAGPYYASLALAQQAWALAPAE